MKREAMNKMGALAGSVVLVGAAAAGAVPAFAADAPATDAAAVEAVGGQAAAETRAVEGTFTYDQAITSSNDAIRGVFAKAAAALCAGLPQYALSCACGAPLMVIGPDGAMIEATVADLAAADEGKSFVMGCACATNAVGGGAIVNAEATGASIASVLAAIG